MICVLNKLKYPDECYAKILQMRHVMIKPLHTESEYLYVKRRTFERGFFIKKNYKSLPQEDLETEAHDDLEDFRLNNDQFGENLKANMKKRKSNLKLVNIFSKKEQDKDNKVVETHFKRIKKDTNTGVINFKIGQNNYNPYEKKDLGLT